MRGLFTDLNIYSTFFEADQLVEWTTGCQHADGDIFTWDRNKHSHPKNEKNEPNVTFVKLDKSEVCLDSDKHIKVQKRSTIGGKSKKKRFKPKFSTKSSFVGKILELITDPYSKTARDCKDRCFRLSGEIMTVPETLEEVNLMHKVMWNYMMKKAENNLTYLSHYNKITDIHPGGETKLEDMEEGLPNIQSDIENREGLWPEKGFNQFYHPITGEKITPYKNLVHPVHYTAAEAQQNCLVCFSGLKNPITPDHFYFFRTTPLCHQAFCGSRLNACPCVFNEDPTFNIRGLCQAAEMDTQYRFAEHQPMTEIDTAHYSWGKDDTRSYIGPRGWLISRDVSDKTWRMSHKKYPDLLITMLDPDALPLGRHNWRIKNNVCNQGQTSAQVLLMSACQEGEFTCDDGKCVNISQRCNTIEVD